MDNSSSSSAVIKLPKTLGIYYGWPSAVNNSSGGGRSVQDAVDAFKMYDILVIAGSLSLPSHSNHEFTKEVIAHPEMRKTDIYGYMSTTETPHAAIKCINDWIEMGNISGIFLDEYGYDYPSGKDVKKNNRAHQNFLLYYIHNSFQKESNVALKAFVNAWRQEDVFAPEPGTGLKHTLNRDDWTLWESYQIKRGIYVEERRDDKTGWRDKAEIIARYRDQANVAVITTTFKAVDRENGATADHDAQFKYAYVSSILDNIDAFAWGEEHYGAKVGLPWRPRPTPEPISMRKNANGVEDGNDEVPLLEKVGSAYQKTTSAIPLYIISVDPTTHEVVFKGDFR
jgi:hypothetical protein